MKRQFTLKIPKAKSNRIGLETQFRDTKKTLVEIPRKIKRVGLSFNAGRSSRKLTVRRPSILKTLKAKLNWTLMESLILDMFQMLMAILREIIMVDPSSNAERNQAVFRKEI